MKIDRDFRTTLYRGARALPDPVKRLGKAALGTYATVRTVSGHNRYVFQHDDRKIGYRYLDAPSLVYLANIIENGLVTHEQVPVDLFDLPEYYDVAIDVGAHFGVYSVLLGVLNDIDMYCFEPNPRNRRVLDVNLAENDVEAVVDGRVVTDETGPLAFYHRLGFDSVSHSTNPPAELRDQFERSEVDSVALSSLLAGYDDPNVFVKIDAEGEETRIVRDLLDADGIGVLSGVLELHPEKLADDGESILAALEREGFAYEQVSWSGQPDYCFTDAVAHGRKPPFERLHVDGAVERREAPAVHSTR